MLCDYVALVERDDVGTRDSAVVAVVGCFVYPLRSRIWTWLRRRGGFGLSDGPTLLRFDVLVHMRRGV